MQRRGGGEEEEEEENDESNSHLTFTCVSSPLPPLFQTVFAVYHHESTYDDLMLLRNGSLAHRLVHRHDDSSSDRVLYPPGKYCVDDMIMAHDGANESVVEFAYICANNQVGDGGEREEELPPSCFHS